MDNIRQSTTREEPIHLRRSLSLLSAVALVCGSVIGSGILVSPGGVAARAQSGGLTIVLWVAAGVTSMLGALVYAELGVTFSRCGGIYEYLKQLCGPYVAFLFAWMYTTFWKPASMSIKMMVFSRYVLQLFYGEMMVPKTVVTLTAIVVASLIMYMNTITVKWSARWQTLLSTLSVSLLLTVITFWLAPIVSGSGHEGHFGFEGSTTDVGSWIVGFFIAGYAYSGYTVINTLVEEIVDPIKNLPRAIITSMSLVTVLFVLTNMSYIALLGMDKVTTSKVLVLDVARYVYKPLEFGFVIAIAFITIGSFNAAVLMGSRIAYVSGRDAMFPRIFGLVNIKYRTPMVSIVIMWSLVILYSTFDLFVIINNTMLANWMFDVLVVAGLVWHRIRNTKHKITFQMPLIVPILYGGFCFALMLFSVILEPYATAMGVVFIIITGTPVYWLFMRKATAFPALDRLADQVLVVVQKVFYSVLEHDEIH